MVKDMEKKVSVRWKEKGKKSEYNRQKKRLKDSEMGKVGLKKIVKKNIWN